MENQDPPQPLQIFSLIHPEREFRDISLETRYEESDAGEAGHTPE